MNGDSSNDNEELELGEFLLTNNEIDENKTLCETVLDGPDDSVTLVNSSEELNKLRNIFEEYKDKLSNASRTARLWIQYLHYIKVLQLFIRAKRTGN